MVTLLDNLARTLDRLDGRGYRAYQDVRGCHAGGDLDLCIDHVQGDPFAAPSRLRVRVPMRVAAIPPELWDGRVREIALSDWLARRTREQIGSARGGKGARGGESARGGNRGGGREGSGGSGRVSVDAGGQEVLERTAVRLDTESVELRLEVGLPARGRRILGSAARRLITETIPDVALAALRLEPGDIADARAFVECIENQEHIRSSLRSLGLIAFVGDGSRLPRQSGASDLPLSADRAVPFESPETLRVRVEVPNPIPDTGAHAVVGMGVPAGVTLIVGGGYHGKSTLLRAIERGVHPHVPGDGREWVVSDPALVKIRAEDGRRVERVDIRGFIDALPSGAETDAFSSDDASGSTSQAAGIVEAVEAGASGLLLDEDTSATNFLVRDARMQALVASAAEPITPYVDRVRELYEGWGVSTVLVMGGSGDYFDVADLVIAMHDYLPADRTEEARAIAREHATGRVAENDAPLRERAARVPDPTSLDASKGHRDVRIRAPERDRIVFGREDIDLRAVEQILDRSQTRAIGLAIHLAAGRWMNGAGMTEVLDAIDAALDAEGLDILNPFAASARAGEHPGNLARPRRFEIAAAISRLRSLRVE